jgi:hypothetical protein
MKIQQITKTLMAFAGLALFGIVPTQGQETPPQVSLPIATTSTSVSNFTVAVTTTDLEEEDNINGFTGYFTFDERIVTFPINGATNAGITDLPYPNPWHVYGALLPGSGPTRTYFLEIWADYPTDSLEGSGTLCNLSVTRVSTTGGSTNLTWDSGHQFGYWVGSGDPYDTVGVNGRISVLCLSSCP